MKVLSAIARVPVYLALCLIAPPLLLVGVALAVIGTLTTITGTTIVDAVNDTIGWLFPDDKRKAQ